MTSYRTAVPTKQPARAVLFAPGNKWNEAVVNSVCERLSNVLVIAYNLTGAPRFPLLSFYSVGAFAEVVLPFCQLLKNYSRVEKAISDVKEVTLDIVDRKHSENLETGSIGQGILDACQQFRSQKILPCKQLEITILTSKRQKFVEKELENIASSIDIDCLKKIQLVIVSGSDTSYGDVGSSSDSQTSMKSQVSGDCVVSGLMDTLYLDSDPLSLQNYFTTWLHYSGTDNENLHLILPAMTIEQPPCIIKCDFQERLLNPALLPFGDRFIIHTESASVRSMSSVSTKTVQSFIHRLEVTSLLQASALCESVLFGMPKILHPTACWKIDWEELEENQHNFKALCHFLLSKELVMICKMLPVQVKPGSSDRVPNGNFIIMAAPNFTLLVKSVAVNELLLPCYSAVQVDEPSDESKDLIESSLGRVKLINSFNPLMFESGLCECLQASCKTQEKFQRRKSQGMENGYQQHSEAFSSYTFGKKVHVPPMKRTGLMPVPQNVKKFHGQQQKAFPTVFD